MDSSRPLPELGDLSLRDNLIVRVTALGVELLQSALVVKGAIASQEWTALEARAASLSVSCDALAGLARYLLVTGAE